MLLYIRWDSVGKTLIERRMTIKDEVQAIFAYFTDHWVYMNWRNMFPAGGF